MRLGIITFSHSEFKFPIHNKKKKFNIFKSERCLITFYLRLYPVHKDANFSSNIPLKGMCA